MDKKQHTRIGDDDYIRPDITKQDIISSNKTEIKNRLEDWILVPNEYIYKLDNGIWVKYVSHEGKYRNGGVIINNSSPEYIVLKNPINKITWSVNIKINHIFIEDQDKKKEIEKMKNLLYDLWKKGEIVIEN